MNQSRQRRLRRFATLSVPVVVLATAWGPAAWADHGPHPVPHVLGGGAGAAWVAPGASGPRHPADHSPHQADPGQADPDSGEATNGGTALPGEAGLGFDQLPRTAAPTAAYQMPFPCGEVWTGSTRVGHSPSVRAVDFNHAGGDEGRSVVAAAAGTVVTAVTGRDRPSYGQYVVIDHGNGETSLYGHLDSVLVNLGQVVPAGTPIGTVGETGNAFGAHLHFEERLDGSVVDPWFDGTPFPMGSTQTSANCGLPVHAAPRRYRLRGDWDGDGRVDRGSWLARRGLFRLRVAASVVTVRFGTAGDLPVVGDWNGDAITDLGVYDPASQSFELRDIDPFGDPYRLDVPAAAAVVPSVADGIRGWTLRQAGGGLSVRPQVRPSDRAPARHTSGRPARGPRRSPAARTTG